MKYQNDATRIRRNLLSKIAKAFFKKKLLKTIDRFPIEFIPQDKKDLWRCCIYKERAIIKYRLMADLGFGIEDETDELKPLSAYVEEALTNHRKEKNVLSVLNVACSSCPGSEYLVTNACRSCMARPCILNCPKNAIAIKDGQAVIDQDLCVDCGKCMQVCPFHAIIRLPIPCEEACPVNAIGKDKSGKAVINFDACISCGQCMNACPFGAVVEKSEFIKVLQAIREKKHVVAMIAPAIIGQFKGTIEQIAQAISKLGFADIIEVAVGADITTDNEIKEFIKRMKSGEHLMTSSCCPAYTEVVKKHAVELLSFVSTTQTPMHYVAELVKHKKPEAVTVFIGPCIAKRKEAQADKFVDFVMTFEELEALFIAQTITPAKCKDYELKIRPTAKGRGFATSCGVTSAILAKCDKTITLNTEFIDGLDQKTIRRLKDYAHKEGKTNFLEVMACEGGCIGGPCTIGKLQVAKQAVQKIAEE
jgi:[FeFe] hydrogenase (group B1/B3)